MTDARIEDVYADRDGARVFLDQAERFLRDAHIAGLSTESQTVLLHNASICACDAILQAVGKRVTPGDGSHLLRLEEALAQLGDPNEELLDALDAARARRHEASYAAGFVAHASLVDAHEATTELMERARVFLAS
ncbi:MAG TPA: hypothetical protein VF101_17910 [Gaiellaceae bacterium]